MTDPASSGAAGAAAVQAAGGAFVVAVGGAGLAAVVVMSMSMLPPRSLPSTRPIRNALVCSCANQRSAPRYRP